MADTEVDGPASGAPAAPAGQRPPRMLDRIARALAVSAAGAPNRPILEAALVFAAFYLVSFVPTDPSAAGRALATPSYHGILLLELAPKALLVLYLMARSDGLAVFGIAAPRPADLYRGLVAALGSMVVVLGPAFILAALGWTNPLLDGAGGRTEAPAAILLPLLFASSLAVGYGEELFFRAYLTRRLAQAGLPLLWAAVASTLVFGSAHGLQGLPGMLMACLLGAWLSWLWLRHRDIHEIALGHALYDAVVMILSIFARGR